MLIYLLLKHLENDVFSYTIYSNKGKSIKASSEQLSEITNYLALSFNELTMDQKTSVVLFQVAEVSN